MAAEPPESREELERRIQEREAKMQKMRTQLGRADSFQKRERRDRVFTRVKLAAVGVAAIIVLSGGVWGASKLASLGPEKCNFHEHASFRVFDEGQQLSFQHPRFDMRNMAMKAHMHQPNDYQVHLEGGCANVKTFFSLMGMSLKPGYLKLDTELHVGKVLRDEGNLTLRFFLMTPDGNWTEKPDLPNHQLRDQQRALITYGNLTFEEIARQRGLVPGTGGG